MRTTAGVAATPTAVFLIGTGTTMREAAVQRIEDLEQCIDRLERSTREHVDTLGWSV